MSVARSIGGPSSRCPGRARIALLIAACTKAADGIGRGVRRGGSGIATRCGGECKETAVAVAS
jgi:hypothetical protein